MGTQIELKVGTIELDWSKNSRGYDHGALFQDGDRTRIRPLESDYDDHEENDIVDEVAERAFVRQLQATVPRLNMLGYTVDAIQTEYEVCLAEWLELQEETLSTQECTHEHPLQFSEFIEFLHRHPIEELDDTFITGFGADEMNHVSKRFKSDPAFLRIPRSNYGSDYSEAEYFGSLISILHPYSVMRLLALVPANSKLDVVWHYGPMVDSGWAREEEFAAGARREQTFLIATEGTSDVHILRHAISLLMPEVSDFFRFIDGSERYPFSGTGSLVKFAEGLVKIDVQNCIVFLFDNDAEGWSALEEVQRYRLPKNMRSMVLPDLEEFRQFPALGPQGTLKGDINRRAAAIECYLDLHLKGRAPARVIWTNYKEKRKIYHGALEYKETYMREFMDQTRESLAQDNYNTSKLLTVLNHICQECQIIAVNSRSTT